MPLRPSNREIADALDQTARLLEERDENPFRVRAFRNAARAVGQEPRSIPGLLRAGGRDALRELPGVGSGLAAAIEEFVLTGRLAQRDRLLEDLGSGAVLETVPGIGPALARRLHDELGLRSLEDLEVAAHDGRLERLEGFGPRRLKALKETLNAMLSRSARRREERHGGGRPSRPELSTLLAVDEAYRTRAAEGGLRKIAPRRFNPEGAAWLPVLNERRDGGSLTALFSNTAQAHRLGKTSDWVVIFFEQGERDGQCTVVTETRGPLAGRRVVRGREAECAALYGIDLRRSG
jgi:DNA polymerase (family X)